MNNSIKILVLCLFAKGFAQDPQLLVNDWYIQKLVIDQIEILKPQNANIATTSFTTSQFEINNECSLDTSFQTEVTYNSTDAFIIGNDAPALLLSCSDGQYQFFLAQHTFSFYKAGVPPNPFTYEISQVGQNLELVVTNLEGNQAFYSNALLSSRSFTKALFSIAPNPVKDILSFSGLNQDQNASIYIYDVFGIRVLNIEKIDGDNNSIDVSKLENGIYFLTIQQENGSFINRKFIKQ